MLQTVVIGLVVALLAAHGALALLGRRLAAETEAALPPVGRFVDTVDGHRVHYRESGRPDAPPLVLVHGASANLMDMEASLAPRLAERFRVVTVDRPGSGWSTARAAAAGEPLEQAADIVRVLDALGIGRAVWIGHSWGGAVVMAALLENAERVIAGVAISAATHPWEEALPSTIRLGATPLVGDVLAACYVGPLGRRVLDDALRDSFRPEAPPDPIAGYRASTGAELALRPASFRAMTRDLVGLGPALERLAPRYPDIARPLLLINGTEDPLIPLERHAARVLEALPAATLVRLEGAGHIVHHTRTDEVAAEIARWLERVAEPSVEDDANVR